MEVACISSAKTVAVEDEEEEEDNGPQLIKKLGVSFYIC